MKNKALVLFSGGQDSTTCLYWAIDKFGSASVSAVAFDYGQRHKIELVSAKKIAKMAGVKLDILPISTFSALGGNALTGSEKVKTGNAKKTGLPNTFVPGRNLIFLTFAAAHAYTVGIHDLVTGVSEADYSGYPDCRKGTIKALETSLSLGMDYKFKIHTPLINLSKKKTVLLAKKLNAFPALALSHTCYNGKRPPCGKCPACILRKKGFDEAGLIDPIG
ncbi:MAG: 7-cyano-7-deazaguanine synthase QueC [Fibrobacteres bacterium]|nr:7-cyano-7-deazaguanine synthase QueC [Fibrobacterota bacterium]